MDINWTSLVMGAAIFALAGLIGYVIYLLRSVKWEDLEREIRRAPDELEGILLDAARVAYQAVEQIATAWDALDNAAKLKLAQDLIEALVRFKLTGKLTPDVTRAAIEYEIRMQKQSKPLIVEGSASVGEVRAIVREELLKTVREAAR